MSAAAAPILTRRNDGGAGALDALARVVADLARRMPLVARCTPRNWDGEMQRLLAVRRALGRGEPSFVYDVVEDASAIADRLDAIADAATDLALAGQHQHQHQPLPGRARGSALESRIIAAIGTPAFRGLAARRFTSSSTDDTRAARWAAYPSRDTGEDRPRILSDDERDPRSLVATMRRDIGARRLPVRVVIQRDLPSLAATGDGVVLVGGGRWLSLSDIARTVLHEIEGHVIPALSRASTDRIRPAGDADTEEGRALSIERAHGFLDEARRKELGLRHVAACLAHAGAGFHEIADHLESLDASMTDAARIAGRALRGGGLGRERVYLPALWRVERA